MVEESDFDASRAIQSPLVLEDPKARRVRLRALAESGDQQSAVLVGLRRSFLTSKTSFQQLVFSQRGVRESTMMRNLLLGFANGFFFLGKAIIASFGESINKIARAQHDEVVR